MLQAEARQKVKRMWPISRLWRMSLLQMWLPKNQVLELTHETEWIAKAQSQTLQARDARVINHLKGCGG